MRLPVLAVLLAVVLTGCGGSSTPAPPLDAQPAPAATGPVPQSRLEAMLLQPSDLAGLPQRRAFASAALTTQSTPQLSLCRPPVAVAEHEVANVIAESGKPGAVKVFEVLAAYGDDAAAAAAYAHDVASARTCTSYRADGVVHRITGLAPLDLGPGVTATHYALVTSDVLSGDVRTLARRGRFTLLISGFGAPPTKQPLLDYQADLMRKALARLG